MQFNVSRYIKYSKRMRNSLSMAKEYVSDRDVRIHDLFFNKYLKTIDRYMWTKEEKRDGLVIDFSQIYPNKYAKLLSDKSIKNMESFVTEIVQKTYAIEKGEEPLENGYFLAIYSLMLWHLYIAFFIRPVLLLKVTHNGKSWDDSITSDSFLNKSEMDKYRLILDIARKDFDKFMNSGISDKELEVIESGVRRILMITDA